MSPRTIERDFKVSEAIDAIGEISPEAKRKILSGEVDLNKKELRELTSKPKEEIETLATEIEDGTYERKVLGKQTSDKIDNLADSISSELKRLISGVKQYIMYKYGQ